MQQFQRKPTFLQHMLDVLENNHNTDEKGLSPEEIEAQSLLFFLAGYETTASTLAFLAYCLATNQECEKKLVQEINASLPTNVTDDFFPGDNIVKFHFFLNEPSWSFSCIIFFLLQDEISIDLISEMPYLDMCLSETLRMYPPVIR